MYHVNAILHEQGESISLTNAAKTSPITNKMKV